MTEPYETERPAAALYATSTTARPARVRGGTDACGCSR
jgi:hypothetical protein